MNTTEPTVHNALAAIAGARRARWIAGFFALLVAAGASAQLRSKPVTGGLESSTAYITLPASPGGSLTAKECSGCPTLRLEFDAGTRYFIGKDAVSYARLREAASKGNDLRLDVSYRLGTRILTRLRLAAAVTTE